VSSRFRSLAGVLRALARTSPRPVAVPSPPPGLAPSLDTERVLEILRRGQRSAAARRERDTPARGLPALPRPPVPGPDPTEPPRLDGGPGVAPADGCRRSDEAGP